MGISNDIRPKKPRPAVKKADDFELPKQSQPENKKDESNEIPIHTTKDVTNEKYDEKYDDFYPVLKDPPKDEPDKLDSFAKKISSESLPKTFNSTPTQDNIQKSKSKHFHEYQPAPAHRPHVATLLIIFFLVFLVVILIWQNFEQIKEVTGFSFNGNSVSTQKDSEIGGVEVISDQDLTLEPSSTDDSQESDADSSSSALNQTPEESSTEQNQAETSESVVADVASVKLEVLNGNGISGSAASVKDQLVNAGYNVLRLANAAKFSYVSTYIYYNTGKKPEADAVALVLSDRQTALYENAQVAGSYDVVVVVGKN